jgi:Fe-S-cluster containining protein
MTRCSGCDGRCCAQYAVPITSYDAARILRLGYSLDYFMDFTHVADMECDYNDIRIGFTHRYMTLKRRKDGSCIFSESVEGALKCRIHGVHPMICRVYPFNPATKEMRGKYLCQKKWKANNKDWESFEKELLEARSYNKKVGEWNAIPGKKERGGFISFILGDDFR